MRRQTILLICFIALHPITACDDDESTSVTEDTGSVDTGADTQATDTTTGEPQDTQTTDTADAADTPDTTEPPGLLPCLDHPSQALEPPTGSLPCTLLHPEFGR